MITRTGDDPFGEFLHDALRGFGVDDRYVTAGPGLPTPVTFCEIFPPDDFPLYFYREPKAPDLEIRADELDLDAIRDADVFWVTGTGLSQEPSRAATLAALEARGRSGHHGARPRLPADVLARPERGPRAGARARSARHRRGRQPATSARSRSASASPRAAAAALLDRGRRARGRQAGPEGRARRTTATSSVEVPPVPSRSSTASAPATRSAARSATACSPAGSWSAAMRFANAAGAIVAGAAGLRRRDADEAEVDAMLEEADDDA